MISLLLWPNSSPEFMKNVTHAPHTIQCGQTVCKFISEILARVVLSEVSSEP